MNKRATLKFKTGPLAGKSFSLGPGEYIFIGSSDPCALKITDDPTVEPTHAAVYYDPSGKILFKDMGTKSGSYVNGKRVTKPIALKVGQRVTLGKFSTFQSSWWNALQATRLTRFSGVLRPGADKSIENKNVPKLFFASMMLLVFIVGGYQMYGSRFNQDDLRDQLVVLDDDQNASQDGSKESMKGTNSGFFNSIFSSKIFNRNSGKKIKKGIEITPERQFIWDEIVAISRRFGDPPPSAMDPGFVREVEKHIQKFTKNNQHTILLARKNEVAHLLEKTLRDKGLPAELAYIVWVESNYKIDAKSPVGAAGLWQFMPETGMEYGLNVYGKTDERMNLQKSTEAAADYFTSLLRMFGTERYLLAIASYNTGQNRVKRKQIAATVHKEHTSDFWQIRFALPKETAEYVPKVIGAMIIGRNPHRYQKVSH